MPRQYTAEQRRRLGTAIKRARIYKGYEDIHEWKDLIGRSDRLLLGIERGETIGNDVTRTKIERALDWPEGWTDRILEDPDADTSPSVPKPAPRYAFSDEPRPLDAYTLEDLLEEIATRYAEQAAELHALGSPAMTERREADSRAQVLEPMSPAQRRENRKG